MNPQGVTSPKLEYFVGKCSKTITIQADSLALFNHVGQKGSSGKTQYVEVHVEGNVARSRNVFTSSAFLTA
jgi:hypothetical protein